MFFCDPQILTLHVHVRILCSLQDTSKILKKLYHEDAKETLASSLFFQYVVLTTDCIARGSSFNL